jgi:HTH-type transcriptional regulator / antitoxin HigA
MAPHVIDDPVDAIKDMMSQKGLTRRDLLPVFGTAALVGEVLNRKRRLSVGHMRVLVFNYGMDARVLLQKY